MASMKFASVNLCLAWLLFVKGHFVHSMPRLSTDLSIKVESNDSVGNFLDFNAEEPKSMHRRAERNVEVDAADDQDAVMKAIVYFQTVIKDYPCTYPQPRVIPVQEIHPKSEVSYGTINVVLHRCAYDSGCCQLSEICVAKETETVDIPILMFNSEKMVEMMQFVNHTECQCITRKEYASGARLA